MSSTKEIQNRKINTKLYPIYKMVSWDLLFYYSIIYLFLTQAKHFEGSQVLLGEAFFTASCLILQIPVGLIVDRFGKKNSLVFANICMCIFTFILLIVSNFSQLLLSFFIDAIGYVIKGVCETNILYDSLPSGKKRGSLYSSIDGLGSSRYYVVDAITSLIAGFAYVITPYLPIVFCLITNIISTILATRFRHTQMPDDVEEQPKVRIKEYFKQLGDAIKFVKKSKRIKCLLIFFALMSGLSYNMTTFRSGVLKQITIPEQYFGVIFAIIQIVAAICSRAQNLVHRKFRNTTLSFLGIPFTASCILIAFFAMLNKSVLNTYIIIFLFVMQGAIKGVYYVLIYRYLNNFTTRKVRVKLATIRNIFYNICSILISLTGALLLHITNASNTILIVGCMTTIAMILLLDYMRDKVGLKPEKYSKEDLKYVDIN